VYIIVKDVQLAVAVDNAIHFFSSGRALMRGTTAYAVSSRVVIPTWNVPTSLPFMS
jgi:hypothetical protein